MSLRGLYATDNKPFYFLKIDYAFIFFLFYGFFIFLQPRTESEFVFFKAYDDPFMSECDHREKFCHITKNRGGFFFRFMNTYQILSKRNYTVALNGRCASSCTYLLNYLHLNNPKSVCITKDATFAIHAGKTQLVSDINVYYVGKLQTLVDKKGGIPPSNKFLLLKYEDLKTIYRSCSGV